MFKLFKSHKFSKIILLMSTFVPAALGQTSDSQAPAPTESSSDAKPSEHPVIDATVSAAKKTAEVIGNVAHRAREGIHEATKPSQDTSKDEEENDECGADGKNDNKSTKETLKEKGKDLQSAAKEKGKDITEAAGDAKDKAEAGVKIGKRKAERLASDAKDKIEETKDKATS